MGLLLLNSSISLSTAIPELRTNLIAYWKMENTSWLDSHTGGYHLTATNSPTIVAGESGNAGKFVGSTNQSAQNTQTGLKSAIDGLAKMTIMFFWRIDKVGSTRTILASNLVTHPNQPDWHFWLRQEPDNGLTFNVFDNGVDTQWKIPFSFTTGTFFHVRFQFDGAGATDADRAKVWVDGVQQTISRNRGTDPIPSVLNTLAASSYRFQFHGTDTGTGNADHVLDEVGIWSDVLTTAQADKHRLKTELPYT